MKHVRPPAWRYYPQPERPRQELRQLIDSMTTLADWLRDDWWRRVELRNKADRTETRLITRELARFLLPSEPAEARSRVLRPGWNVEGRDRYPKMPFLYGENDDSIKGVQPDAVYLAPDGRLTIVEIEGGGAETNYRGMKDIVEALLLPDVDYLALVVPFSAHHTEPYAYYNNLVTSMYAQQVIQAHLKGLLIVGY